MSVTISADILVVGLGPAGAAAASVAAASGAAVVAIDRKRRAGLPVQCAEFVPAMLRSGFDGGLLSGTGGSRRQAISSMTTFVEDAVPHVKEHFPGHMIDRAAFDAALVGAAEERGATCIFDVGLARLDANGIAQLSDGRTIGARVVIGADGPRSRVGRAIGQINVALVETRQITVPMLRASASTDIFLSAEIPGGYAWLFPKAEAANIGVGVARRWRSRLKPILEGLHRRLVAEGRVGQAVIRRTGGAIPVGGMLKAEGALGQVLVLLAGDAAGLTNPVTGAGINSAVASGQLAGEAALHHLAGKQDAGRDYADNLDDLFKASIDRALVRRQGLMQTYERGAEPSRADLRQSWIAFPQYWAA